MSRTPRRRAVLMAVVATAALGACGSTSTAGGGARSRTTQPEVAAGTGDGTTVRTQAREYARCMRDHGVDFPDPTFDRDGRVELGTGTDARHAGGADPTATDSAREACESTWPGMEGRYPRTPAELARMRAELLAFAACMRAQGVDFPDPTFDRDGRPDLAHDHGSAAPAAVQVCRDQLGDRPVMGHPGSR